MSQLIKRYFLAFFIFFVAFLSFNNYVNASELNFKVNGENFDYPETVIIEGRIYMPVRKFSTLMGADVFWDSKNKQVSVSKGYIQFHLTINNKKVNYIGKDIYIDSPALLKEGTAYAPVRFIAEALYHNVTWDAELKTVIINAKKSYMVNKGDTLLSISQKFSVDVESLKEWNHLKGDLIEPNTKLFLEPVNLHTFQIPAQPVIAYTNEDLELLAKIVYAEARDEPYEGLLAVAAVVINRVQDSTFPDSIYGVIFQKGQFTPAMNGKIYDIKPDENSYKAAEEALLGIDPVEGALFFFNPNISNSTFFSKKELIRQIGHHNFYR